MVGTVAALAIVVLAQQPVDKPTLELYQQRFVIRTPKEVFRIPLKVAVEPPPAVMFRKDSAYAVWDERGLTARSGDWSYTTRLKEMPSASRFFSRDEILKTTDLVRRGQRSFEAKAISGAKRLGNKAYFLVRWDDATNKPWLEALVSIDLTEPKPKPKVLGLFEGPSLANQPIDDRLTLRDEGLELPVQSSNGWGLGRFDPKDELFSFRPLGNRLQSLLPLSKDMALFTEEAPYGMTTVGQIDLRTGERKLMFESRGDARFLDALKPEIIVSLDPPGRSLHNAATGAEVTIGASDEIRRAGPYILVWSPAATPKSARLFDPSRWSEIATWKANR